MENSSRLNAKEPGAVRRQAVKDAIKVINAERIEKTANEGKWVNMFRQFCELIPVSKVIV